MRRIVAIGIAGCAALLISIAGKACTDNIIESNKETSKKLNTIADNTYGSMNNYTSPNMQNTSESTSLDATETESAEVVTNLLGEVVGTVPVTSATTEEDTSNNTTTNNSILDRADDAVQPTTSSNSGNSILNRDQEQVTSSASVQPTTEKYTTPSSVSIYIG